MRGFFSDNEARMTSQVENGSPHHEERPLDWNYRVRIVNPCGNFSDTSSVKFPRAKGSIGHAFTVCIRTENQNQVSFYPFVLHEISVLIELTLGHLRYLVTDVPPQPNSPPDCVSNLDRTDRGRAGASLQPARRVLVLKARRRDFWPLLPN